MADGPEFDMEYDLPLKPFKEMDVEIISDEEMAEQWAEADRQRLSRRGLDYAHEGGMQGQDIMALDDAGRSDINTSKPILPGWTPTDPPEGLERFSKDVQQATGGRQWMRPDGLTEPQRLPDPIAPEEGFYPNWASKIAQAVGGRKTSPGQVYEQDGSLQSLALPARSARTIGNWLHSAHDSGVPTYTSVQQAIDGLVAAGFAEYAGVDEDGEQQYLLTDKGTALADTLIEQERAVGTIVIGDPVCEPDGVHRMRGIT